MQLISILLQTAALAASLIPSTQCETEAIRKSRNFKPDGTRRVVHRSRAVNGNPNYLKSMRPVEINTLSNYYGNNLAPAPPLNEFTDSDADEVQKKVGRDQQQAHQEESDEVETFAAATVGQTNLGLNYGTTDFERSTRSPAGLYLKAINDEYDRLDDLEFEYANDFLKRGLVLAADFEGGSRWDEKFMATLKRFYASLMQQTQPFLPEISSKWRAMSGENVYRSARLYTRHKSIDCGNLAMKLKMTGIIYDGHRNRVIKLFDRSSKKTFAYKTYGNPDEFYVEQEKFLWLDHPYYINAVCHRKDMDSGKAGILFEYVDGVSSMEYARSASPEQLKMISAQLFLAIEHLHWLGIVHADLKPENVLIKKDGTVQVIDLGFATHLPQSKRRRGTHTTMAPELHFLVPGRVHEAIDWWAYGSTVAMWYGFNYAYKNDGNTRFIPMNWQDNQFTEGVVPWRFPQELRNFLQIFFQPDPNSRRLHTKRLLKQVRNDPFFNGLDWSQLHGGIMN